MLIVDLLLESHFTQDLHHRAIRFHDLGVKFGMKLQKHFVLKVKLLLKKSLQKGLLQLLAHEDMLISIP